MLEILMKTKLIKSTKIASKFMKAAIIIAFSDNSFVVMVHK